MQQRMSEGRISMISRLYATNSMSHFLPMLSADAGHLYYANPFAMGYCTLERWLEKNQPSEQFAVRVAYVLLGATEALGNTVHGGMRVANIFVDGDSIKIGFFSDKERPDRIEFVLMKLFIRNPALHIVSGLTQRLMQLRTEHRSICEMLELAWFSHLRQPPIEADYTSTFDRVQEMVRAKPGKEDREIAIYPIPEDRPKGVIKVALQFILSRLI